MDDRERARKGKMVALAEGSGKCLFIGCFEDSWLIHGTEIDWVVQQTQERHRRELEAEEMEYEQRLAAARKKEAEMKRMANARVHKRPVSIPRCAVVSYWLILGYRNWTKTRRMLTMMGTTDSYPMTTHPRMTRMITYHLKYAL